MVTRAIARSGMVVIATVAAGCSVLVGNRSTAPRPDGTIGCRTSNTPALVDTAVVALGLVMIEQGATCQGFCVGADALTTTGLVLGVAGAASAIYGLAEVRRCDDAHENLAHDLQARKAAAEKERAWQLTLQAEQAARADDCAAVSALQPQIAALDVDMRDSVFARDVGVIRCLAPAQGSGAR